METANQKAKADYEAYKAHHICVACGRREAEPNRVRCFECLEKNKFKKRQRKIIEIDGVKYTTAWTRKHRQEQKEKGLCIFCNKPLSKYSKCFCADHRIANQKKNNVRKDGISRSERPMYGMCYRCSNPITSGKLCDKCKQQSIDNLPKEVNRNGKGYKAWKRDNDYIFGGKKQ